MEFREPETINTEKAVDTMTQENIRKIKADIEKYEEAIRNAEGALAEAERELEETLNEAYPG